MIRLTRRLAATVIASALFAAPALAAGEIEIKHPSWTFSGPFGTYDNQQLQRGFRNAGVVHQCNRARRYQAGLFGRFGDHSVTRRKGGENLSAKDRQRKVPRRNAGNHTARFTFVAYPFSLVGIKQCKIHRLADLADRIEPSLAGFACSQSKQFFSI